MISIIIPTYNRSHLLPRAISSVINQTFSEWELIIVDDGSTDATEDVLKPLLKDPRINYVKKENSGAAHSRNVGVEHSKGEYITFLDSDDEAKPNWLSQIAIEIGRSSPELVCCGCEIIDHEGNLVSVNLPDVKKELFGNLQYKMTNGGVFTLKKELFLQVGGYDPDLKSGQHTELSFRIIPLILNKSDKIVNIKKSLIKIHIHLGERIRGDTAAKYLGSKRVLEKHQDFFKSRPHAKSLYSGVVAYNAHLLGDRKEALKYSRISFNANPSPKGLLRIIKYIFLKSEV